MKYTLATLALATLAMPACAVQPGTEEITVTVNYPADASKAEIDAAIVKAAKDACELNGSKGAKLEAITAKCEARFIEKLQSAVKSK